MLPAIATYFPQMYRPFLLLGVLALVGCQPIVRDDSVTDAAPQGSTLPTETVAPQLDGTLSESITAPNTQALPAAACPEAVAGTHQLLAPAQGICFLYPDTYNAFQGEDGTITLYVRALVGSHVPLAFINYSAAEGQSLKEITAQRLRDYAWTGTEPESITLGGEAAMMLDNLPGQDTNRRVVAVHDGRVYDLMISGIGANYGTAGELAEALYDTVIASLQFIEVEPQAPLRAGPECPEVKADTVLYTSEPQGYCLLLPAAYSPLQVDETGAEMAFYVDSMQDTIHARLFIKVTDADSRSLEEVTLEREAEIEKIFAGSDVEWSWGSLLDGEPANQLYQVPGQDLSREVVTLHAGHLYTLTFVPDDPEAGETYAEMESLYEMVTDSFSFLWQSEKAQ